MHSLVQELPDRATHEDYYQAVEKPTSLKEVGCKRQQHWWLQLSCLCSSWPPPTAFCLIVSSLFFPWQIHERILSDKYINLNKFSEDFKLMLLNAQVYYKAGSQVFADAKALAKVFEARLSDAVAEVCVVMAETSIGVQTMPLTLCLCLLPGHFPLFSFRLQRRLVARWVFTTLRAAVVVAATSCPQPQPFFFFLNFFACPRRPLLLVVHPSAHIANRYALVFAMRPSSEPGNFLPCSSNCPC